MSRLSVWLAGGLMAVALLSACSSNSPDAVDGIVIDVEGMLTQIESFVLLLPDGTRLRLEPAPGVLFNDRIPVGHLRDHLRSGEPVEVRYRTMADGTRSAFWIGDS